MWVYNHFNDAVNVSALRTIYIEEQKDTGRFEVYGEFSKDYATTLLYVGISMADAQEYVEGIMHKENQAQTGGY